jgi:hypothetical protein
MRDNMDARARGSFGGCGTNICQLIASTDHIRHCFLVSIQKNGRRIGRELAAGTRQECMKSRKRLSTARPILHKTGGGWSNDSNHTLEVQFA